MRLKKKVVDDFLKLQKDLREVIKASGITHVSVYREIGMSKTIYYEKLKEQSFNGSELLKILEVVNR